MKEIQTLASCLLTKISRVIICVLPGQMAHSFLNRALPIYRPKPWQLFATKSPLFLNKPNYWLTELGLERTLTEAWVISLTLVLKQFMVFACLFVCYCVCVCVMWRWPEHSLNQAIVVSCLPLSLSCLSLSPGAQHKEPWKEERFVLTPDLVPVLWFRPKLSNWVFLVFPF